ncbi:MAG TPA: hypothetical protein VM639_06915 [Dongiaceae bacterium]|nr:hypothetical protein [Dongiaceae bacterium]
MTVFHPVAYFFGGAFLANAVPHFTSGVMGRRFPTPFANPPGRGLSSPTANVLWGALNIAIGYLLASCVGDFQPSALGDTGSLGLGALLMGLFLARHFGGLHEDQAQGRS